LIIFAYLKKKKEKQKEIKSRLRSRAITLNRESAESGDEKRTSAAVYRFPLISPQISGARLAYGLDNNPRSSERPGGRGW